MQNRLSMIEGVIFLIQFNKNICLRISVKNEKDEARRHNTQ